MPDRRIALRKLEDFAHPLNMGADRGNYKATAEKKCAPGQITDPAAYFLIVSCRFLLFYVVVDKHRLGFALDDGLINHNLADVIE